MKGIQSYLSGIFVIQNSTRQALIGQLRFVDLQGLGEDYLKTYVQRVNAVTPDDVKHTTAKYIKPELMTIVVVGDKAKISEQLAPLCRGCGEITARKKRNRCVIACGVRGAAPAYKSCGPALVDPILRLFERGGGDVVLMGVSCGELFRRRGVGRLLRAVFRFVRHLRL